MLKTISAALLAASVLAAPALAAANVKADIAPVTRTDKAAVKPSVLNANAKMNKTHKHHAEYARHHRHPKKMAYRHHKRVASIKAKSKVRYKPALSTTKRG